MNTPSASPNDYDPRHNPHKQQRGLHRVWRAFGHSLSGLRYALREETAFRQELLLCALLLPWPFVVSFSTLERLLLVATLLFVLVTELLNCAIEAAIDRISLAEHGLSKRAKDYGSAAVLLTLLLCATVWLTLFYPHLHTLWSTQ